MKKQMERALSKCPSKTNSGIIYEYLCEKMNWNKAYAKNFGKQNCDMYAQPEKVTPQGYNVWFLAYSNLSLQKGNNNITNEISEDFESIKECWTKLNRIDIATLYEKDYTPRFVFAKIKGGKGQASQEEYRYLGVYVLATPLPQLREMVKNSTDDQAIIVEYRRMQDRD
ncbi:MAG: hypothetical protein NC099_00790 [Corallococcus sp.]|nr:hypothetical protein [Corallococcus sp.]